MEKFIQCIYCVNCEMIIQKNTLPWYFCTVIQREVFEDDGCAFGALLADDEKQVVRER